MPHLRCTLCYLDIELNKLKYIHMESLIIAMAYHADIPFPRYVPNVMSNPPRILSKYSALSSLSHCCILCSS